MSRALALRGLGGGAEAIIALSLALTGRAAVGLLCVMVVPIVTLSARFSLRGILIGLAATLGMMVAVAFSTNPHEVIHDPPLLVAPFTVVIAVAMLSVALMDSDIEHRSKAVIDQLTGLLNRNALAARAHELEQQSAITGQPVGIIVGDLDDFKRINDTAGHPVGDAVLKDVAYLIRKHLRAFDLAYRLGGDEFLVLVPGSDVASTSLLAEELGQAVSAEALVGRHVTMSFGVSASSYGEVFDCAEVLGRADEALYEAKAAGGRCVCVYDRAGVHRPVVSALRATSLLGGP